MTLLADWGFDGLDIDWEYPQDAKEAHNFVELLAACRRALDAYAAEHGQDYRYLLTVAASAGSQHYSKLNLAALDGYVDSWHLMAYDYAGSWDNTAGHQANLYADTAIEASTTKFSTHLAVSDYIEAGVHPQKIVLGLPLYGRSFINTEGLGHPFTGVGNGTIEQGVWLYRDLPLQTSNAVVQVDEQLAAAYTYDSGTRELISFDNVETALLKARYIRENGLGGAFFWEAAGDKTGDESLIATLAGEMLGSMDDSPNMLDYPASRYVNIKDGMREGV